MQLCDDEINNVIGMTENWYKLIINNPTLFTTSEYSYPLSVQSYHSVCVYSIVGELW